MSSRLISKPFAAFIPALSLAIGVVTAPFSASADLSFRAPGGYLATHSRVGSFALDELGTPSSATAWSTHTMAFLPELSWGSGWRVATEIQVFQGVFQGDLATEGDQIATGHPRADAWRNEFGGTPFESVALRTAFLEWETDASVLRLGQMTSHWGQGLVANDGGHNGAFRPSLNRDIVERLLFSVRPFAGSANASEGIRVSFAMDVVWSDDNASLEAGDLAIQGVASLAFGLPGRGWLGMYAALREQEDADGDRLEALVLDGAGSWRFALADTHSLIVEAEVAGLLGSTDRTTSEAVDGPVEIASLGGVASLGWRHEVGLELELEAGYASGDDNPHDGVLRTFSFDPSRRVGMILFEDVLSRMTAHGADRVMDPALSGQPPRGAEGIATGGRVHNAVFLAPTVRVRATPSLVFHLGALWARSMAPLNDPYQTGLAGGVLTGPRGRVGGAADLGVEVMTGFEGRVALGEHASLLLGIRGATLLAGSALDSADGESLGHVTKLEITAGMHWE
jgi:hypothetical protein